MSVQILGSPLPERGIQTKYLGSLENQVLLCTLGHTPGSSPMSKSMRAHRIPRLGMLIKEIIGGVEGSSRPITRMVENEGKVRDEDCTGKISQR